MNGKVVQNNLNKLRTKAFILFFIVSIFLISLSEPVMACLFASDCAHDEACSWFSCYNCGWCMSYVFCSGNSIYSCDNQMINHCEKCACASITYEEYCPDYNGWTGHLPGSGCADGCPAEFGSCPCYNCCDGTNQCVCQDQYYLEYTCGGSGDYMIGLCRGNITNTRVAKINCGCVKGQCGAECCSTSDCPVCSNNVNPTCVSNTCHCDACTTTSQCISGYCCEFEKGGSQTCRYLGYIYGNVYLCDP